MTRPSIGRSAVAGLVVALLVLAVPTIGCNSGPSSAGAAPSKAEADAKGSGGTSGSSVEPIPVETWSVTTRDFSQTFEVPGTIEASRRISVAAESPGRITRVPFEEGETVETGQLLLGVEAETDQSRIRRLEHQIETAKREYERTQNLAEEGVATSQQLDQARSRYEELKLRLEEAESGLEKATTRSPVEGHVAERFVDSGEYASPGAPIAEIVDLETLQVTASVPESKIEALDEKSSVELRIPALGTTVSASISKLPVDVSAKSRTYPVELRLANEDNRIRPGMRATLTITEKVWSDAVVVPRTAILQGYSRKEVAVATGPVDAPDQNSQVELREVQLGPGAGNRVVVTDGLEADDRLIVRGHRSLTGGMPVEIVETYDSLRDVLDLE